MGSGSKQYHFVRCGSEQAGWSERNSCGVLAPDRMLTEGLCESAAAALGWKVLRAAFCVVFFKVRGQEMLMEKKKKCALAHNFIQTDPFCKGAIGGARVVQCPPGKPELGDVWLSLTKAPLINNGGAPLIYHWAPRTGGTKHVWKRSVPGPAGFRGL